MYHLTVRLFLGAVETFACIVINKLLRIYSMMERGLKEHELKAFGLVDNSGKPKIRSGRWHPKMQKGKASGQDNLESSEFLLLSGQSTSS